MNKLKQSKLLDKKKTAIHLCGQHQFLRFSKNGLMLDFYRPENLPDLEPY